VVRRYHTYFLGIEELKKKYDKAMVDDKSRLIM